MYIVHAWWRSKSALFFVMMVHTTHYTASHNIKRIDDMTALEVKQNICSGLTLKKADWVPTTKNY